MTGEAADLESLLDEFCDTQVTQHELRDKILQKIKTTSVETLNALPDMYRLEIRNILQEEGQFDLASKIETAEADH